MSAHSTDTTEDTGMTGTPDASQRFTASVSHEIRTPLNGILGMVSLLEETGLSQVQKEYVDAIRKSGSRLLDLLNNVLDFSRLEAGDIPLDIAPFDPTELIQDVVELLAPRAHASGLDLAAAPMTGLIQAYEGDVGRIRQILFNLAGNAIKFTETGGVLITAGPLDGGGVRFTVLDSGQGISAEDQSRIFNAFGQVSASDAGRDSGVGLGLAIALRLARAMGGEIRIESKAGEGAAFYLDLPLEQAECLGTETDPCGDPDGAPVRVRLIAPHATEWVVMTALAAADGHYRIAADGEPEDVAILEAGLPPAQIAEQASRAPTLVILRPEDRTFIPKFRQMGCVGYLIRPLRGVSVEERVRLVASGGVLKDHQDKNLVAPANARALIADDNPVNSLLAKRALLAAGFNVDTVGTGAEALEAVMNAPYSVIFMDVRMPVMDGLEATRRIRALEGAMAQTPIIAVTADVDPNLETRAREVGVSLIAAKPIDPTRLRDLALEWATSQEAAT